MADDDFFTSQQPAGDDSAGAFFMAPPSGNGDDSHIGDTYYGTIPDEQTNDFFNPPAPVASADGDAFGGGDDGVVDAPMGYEAPADDGDDVMGFAAAVIVPPGVVEDVDDDEEEIPTGGGIVASEQLVIAESTPMAKWNEEWLVTLQSRKDEDASIKAEHIAKAESDIAAFQAEREKRREARMAKNRSDEQDKLEAIEADLENDNSWQKVVKMIELNQDSSEGAVDTSRMKDILVLLKNDPAMAEALTA
ncbi:hypothetical protein ACHAXH_007473 [Discostella pseudostelligera]|jgi:hypothetical protein